LDGWNRPIAEIVIELVGRPVEKPKFFHCKLGVIIDIAFLLSTFINSLILKQASLFLLYSFEKARKNESVFV
jgi:hypothetical protein